TDVFELEAVYLGRIKKLVIGHDGKGAGYGWFLDSVQVTAASKPDAPVAGRGRRGRQDHRELRPQEQQQQQQKQQPELPLDPLEKLAWQSLAWLFQPDTVIQLYSRVTGRPVRINSDNSVD
uniref:PLAT domain-containing protein n=1 Tax=Macrostomum lignano TaxID=282301 RepID=A0A1I8GSK1_9PLAT